MSIEKKIKQEFRSEREMGERREVQKVYTRHMLKLIERCDDVAGILSDYEKRLEETQGALRNIINKKEAIKILEDSVSREEFNGALHKIDSKVGHCQKAVKSHSSKLKALEEIRAVHAGKLREGDKDLERALAGVDKKFMRAITRSYNQRNEIKKLRARLDDVDKSFAQLADSLEEIAAQSSNNYSNLEFVRGQVDALLQRTREVYDGQQLCFDHKFVTIFGRKLKVPFTKYLLRFHSHERKWVRV